MIIPSSAGNAFPGYLRSLTTTKGLEKLELRHSKYRAENYERKATWYFEETTLMGQKYVKDDKKSIRELLPKGVTIKAFVRMRVGA